MPLRPLLLSEEVEGSPDSGCQSQTKGDKKKISYLSNETLIEMTKEASIYLLELQKRYLNIAVSSKFINNKPKILFSTLGGFIRHFLRPSRLKSSLYISEYTVHSSDRYYHPGSNGLPRKKHQNPF